MQNLKVGVWLPANYKPEEGGGYSYFDLLIEHIDQYIFDDRIDICFISSSKISLRAFKKPLIVLKDKVRVPFYLRAACMAIVIFPKIGKMLKRFVDSLITDKRNAKFVEQLYKNKIDLIYYPLQSQCAIKDFPFISTNWDLGHITSFAFPEVNMNGIHEDREIFYKKILPRALCIFAESQAGKSELVKYLNIPEKKIKIVSLFPGRVVFENIPINLRMEKLRGLGLRDQQYFFYPAQYWAHKNHYGLLNAYKIVLQQLNKLKLVFCGGDKGNLSYVKNIIEELQLKESVYILGFVENDLMYSLYKHALALIMPTYIGPTNMPLLEALMLNCPILCSDLRGHRELLGDAALYFPPSDINSMADSMIKINNQHNREELLSKGSQRKLFVDFSVTNSVKQIEENLREIIPIRRCWG